jgi:hypothetical protein
MYYLFLKPDAVSQFPLPASKKAAAPVDGAKAPAKAATKPATKQKGLKGPAKGDDANK